MYCSKCGAQNKDEASSCVICGTALVRPEEPADAAGVPPPPPPGPPTAEPARAPAAQTPTMESPPNYLVVAILSTLFCCWPTGIVAIVFAAQVSSKVAASDIDGARRASANAKLWTWITFGLGLASWLLFTLFAIIGAAGGM